jgi:tripartite-type tricarboxylate transporter receptor subunit TctC
LSGEIQVMFGGVAGSLESIRTGKLNALVITRDTRIPALPDEPTLAEAAKVEPIESAWSGILAPAKTPADILRKLHDDIVEILRAQEYQEMARTKKEPAALR